MADLTDRHIIITGATGGLGGAVVRAAVAGGASVTVPHLASDDPARLASSLPEGARVDTRVANASEEDDVAALFDACERVDALIHLVGGFRMDAFDALTLADFRAHHELVLTTTFLCCKHALRRMRGQGYGRIVTIGSKAVDQPMGQTAAYASAKAGVVALTRVLAEETKGSDITANCVMPSIIDTPANRAAMGEPQGWVTPASLAETITFLASAAAGDLRGAVIPVYGNV